MFTLTPGLMQYRKAPGFTMVELLVVMVIVGILASVAIPSFRSFVAQQRIKNASFDIASLLVFARSEAIKRNASVTLNYDPALDALTVTTSGIAAPLAQQEMFTGIQIECVDMTASPHAYATCPAGGAVYNSNGRLVSAFGPLEVYGTAVSGVESRCITIDLSGRPNSRKGAC